MTVELFKVFFDGMKMAYQGTGEEYANMEALRRAMRKDPEKFGGCIWTLISKRPHLEVRSVTSHTVVETPLKVG
jgi:hypothetical protein